MSARGIRVVLFDLDDTLFAHRGSVELGLLAHRAALGGPIAAADRATEFARWNALEEEHYHRYLGGELDFLGQRRARARGFVAPYGLDLDDARADAWFDAYLIEYEATWRLHDDAAACLDAMDAAGTRVGIITNGDIRFQTAKLDALGLSPRLEHVIASGSVGVAKPDPRIFEIAAAAFGEPLDSCAYVGDRLHTDAIGAARAGMTGVWIDRPGTATPEQRAEAAAAGAAVIASLAELPALLT